MKRAAINMATIAAVIVLAGCAQMRAHKGMVMDPQLEASVQPGVDNKDSVEKLLGHPTFVGQFTPNDWYYVSRDTTQLAFRNPRVRKQDVMIVRFDPKGNVASVQHTGKALVMNVKPYGKETPTLGRTRSFFEELFGNIGSVGAGLPGGGEGGGGPQ
jgi:outer membrane protein assembly factor BamE (lipoprotein component of BamABCDE complex)